MQSDSRANERTGADDTAKIGPGDWAEQVFDGAEMKALGQPETFADYGQDTANAVLAKAQDRVSSHSVIIATTGEVGTDKTPKDMRPASGVIVKLRSRMYGILTAAHVLRRGDNRSDLAGVTVLASPKRSGHHGTILSVPLPPRPCTVYGFHNKSENGPDLAIIPLDTGEWSKLNFGIMVAYNLNKERWSDAAQEALGKSRWCLSLINGVRCEASEIVRRHSESKRLRLSIMATPTRIGDETKRGGYDYLELPSETTDDSYPTQWHNDIPDIAAEEIEALYDKGVTAKAWGGVSGAGIWKVVVGANRSAEPNDTVRVELAGICFFANPDKGCIIAHGAESIKSIAEEHAKNSDVLRFYSKT